MKIIFALGNPEPEYSNTRHNVGFAVLNKLAESLEAKWVDKPKYTSLVAETVLDGQKVLLVKPYTFYNEAGLAARKIIDYMKIDASKDLVVVHDDLALPFGTIRFRESGSDAGNNGIKSLISHLGKNFARVRIGIHNQSREQIEDGDFVVDKFSQEEESLLEKHVIPQAIEITGHFCQEKTTHISYKTLDK